MANVNVRIPGALFTTECSGTEDEVFAHSVTSLRKALESLVEVRNEISRRTKIKTEELSRKELQYDDEDEDDYDLQAAMPFEEYFSEDYYYPKSKIGQGTTKPNNTINNNVLSGKPISLAAVLARLEANFEEPDNEEYVRFSITEYSDDKDGVVIFDNTQKGAKSKQVANMELEGTERLAHEEDPKEDVPPKGIINKVSKDVAEYEQKVKNSEKIYNELISTHKGELKEKDLIKYRRKSGLKQAEQELIYWKNIKKKIDNMIKTFELVMPEEFNYLNNLPVNIHIVYKDESNEKNQDSPLNTVISPTRIDFMEYGDSKSEEVWTGEFKKDIEITIYKNENNNSFKTNYLANEFGDIDYFFKYVKPYDPESLKKWGTTGSSKYQGYFLDPTGAGRMSFDYQHDFEKKFNILRKTVYEDEDKFDVDIINWIIKIK